MAITVKLNGRQMLFLNDLEKGVATRVVLSMGLFFASISAARGESIPYMKPDGQPFRFESAIVDLKFLPIQPGSSLQFVAADSGEYASLIDLTDRSVIKLPFSVANLEGDVQEKVDCVAIQDNGIVIGGRMGSVGVLRPNAQGVYEMSVTWQLKQAGITGLSPLSAKSKCLVRYSDKSIEAVDVATGRRLREWSTRDRIVSVASSADGKVVAVTDEDNAVKIIRCSDFAEVRRIDIAALVGQAISKGAIKVTAMSPNGSLFYALIHDGPLISVDWKKGLVMGRFDPRISDDFENWDPGHSIDASPDGRFVATGSESGFGLVFSGEQLQRVSQCDHESFRLTSGVCCVKWSPKGDLLATCGRDRKVILWNTRKLQE